MPLSGEAIADSIANEINGHVGNASPRHFVLPATARSDCRTLATELWADIARSGPLWSNIRLVHEGRDLHPSEFMQGRIGDGLVVHSWIDSAAVTRYLTQGATFIYNHLHETSYGVQRIQEILEYRIAARVWIQAYLTTSELTAFGLHRDDHNFVALQIGGLKQWTLESDGVDGGRQLLAAGEGLFLRAGTPHAVSGVGELSLHLTIAFDWLPTAPEQPGSRLGEEEFLAHAAVNRLGSALPIALDGSLLQEDVGIRFASRVKPRLEFAGERLLMTCAVGTFRLDRRLNGLVELLGTGREMTVGELIQDSGLTVRQVETFVRFGVEKGILFSGS
jgi:hypothetical protein